MSPADPISPELQEELRRIYEETDMRMARSMAEDYAYAEEERRARVEKQARYIMHHVHAIRLFDRCAGDYSIVCGVQVPRFVVEQDYGRVVDALHGLPDWPARARLVVSLWGWTLRLGPRGWVLDIEAERPE